MRFASVFLGLSFSLPAMAVEEPGFGSFRLADGTPEFVSCLNSKDCSSRFYAFLSEASMGQGFAMQDGPVVGSSLINDADGFFAGGMLHSFPLGPPPKNLAGKEENTNFSPVLPKLFVGKASTDEKYRNALSLSFLPPVPVKGAAALVLGLNGSLSWQSGNHVSGVESDFTFVRATAPVTASKEQMDQAESKGYEDNLKSETFEANCDPDVGCTDVFSLMNLSIRYGMNWSPGETWQPYSKVGLTVVSEQLYVQYDDTTWRGFALQPTLHGGIAIAVSDPILLAAGGTLGLKQSNQSTGGMGVFSRFEGSAAWRF